MNDQCIVYLVELSLSIQPPAVVVGVVLETWTCPSQNQNHRNIGPGAPLKDRGGMQLCLQLTRRKCLLYTTGLPNLCLTTCVFVTPAQ